MFSFRLLVKNFRLRFSSDGRHSWESRLDVVGKKFIKPAVQFAYHSHIWSDKKPGANFEKEQNDKQVSVNRVEGVIFSIA